MAGIDDCSKASFLFDREYYIYHICQQKSDFITHQMNCIEPFLLLVFFPSGLIECEKLLLCSALMIIVCNCTTISVH